MEPFLGRERSYGESIVQKEGVLCLGHLVNQYHFVYGHQALGKVGKDIFQYSKDRVAILIYFLSQKESKLCYARICIRVARICLRNLATGT